MAAHPRTNATSNTCQHCLRSFAKPNALGTHLREYCTRIPILARKRLLEKDNATKTIKTPKLRRSRHELIGLYRIKGIANIRRKLIRCYNCGVKFSKAASYADHAAHCFLPKQRIDVLDPKIHNKNGSIDHQRT
jgi:hypothetical protein